MNYKPSRIASKLYVGSFPPAELRHMGFDVVVLCAAEAQDVTPDIATVHFPFDDGPLPNRVYQQAVKTAMVVSKLRHLGQRVLVTCFQGVNRSAFVAALSLMQRECLSAPSAIELVRRQRQPDVNGWRVLSNDDFVEALAHFESLVRCEARPFR